jgi:hypothetical protein
VTAPPAHACFVVEDPYARPGAWYRGNFHVHTSHSDGALAGGDLVTMYGTDGYGVLCITDHNQHGDQDGGVLPFLQADSILHDWNGDGVVHRERVPASGVEAYVRDWARPRPKWALDDWYRPGPLDRAPAPVVLPGCEATFGGFHIGCIGHPPGWIEPPNAGTGYIQRTRGAGGFVFLAHPGDWNHVPQNLPDAIDLRGFHGIEIVNGLRLTQTFPRPVAARGAPHTDDSGCAASGAQLPWDATPLWDGLLARGIRVWGMANDDAHTLRDSDTAYPFSAFNMLHAGAATPDGFLQALHAGAFYASNGLYFGDLSVRGDSLCVWAPGATNIRFVGWNGRLLGEAAAARAAYKFSGNEGYVRVEAAGVPARTPWAPRAWSQPFWLRAASCQDPAALRRDSSGG